MAEYILFNEKQLDWIEKTVRDMALYTKCVGKFENPMSDDDWNKIIERFSLYAKKSHNNKFIIDSGISFLLYLSENDKNCLIKHGDTTIKSSNDAPLLDEEQFQYVDDFICRGFQMLKDCDLNDLKDSDIRYINEQLNDYFMKLSEHALIGNLKETFMNYMDFCKKQTRQTIALAGMKQAKQR